MRLSFFKFQEYGPVYPDPKEWTDEELGIPPDDAD